MWFGGWCTVDAGEAVGNLFEREQAGGISGNLGVALAHVYEDFTVSLGGLLSESEGRGEAYHGNCEELHISDLILINYKSVIRSRLKAKRFNHELFIF